MPKKEKHMFHNLEEDRINLEAEQRENKNNEEVLQAQVSATKVTHARYLECPFCYNKQNDINSKDVTSAWCYKCGKAFEAHWK